MFFLLIVQKNERNLPAGRQGKAHRHPYQSGNSIKGKTRVSHMANKKLKTNLHLAALNAIKLDPELKAYYNRKVLDGKSKMSVINAVRFKLLARVGSAVKNDGEYVKKTA
jgi:transposase